MTSYFKSILIGIVCHDTESRNEAITLRDKIFDEFDAHIIEVDRYSMYFENQAFSELSKLALTKDYKYVGLVTYSFGRKIFSNLMEIILELKAKLIMNDVDILTFFNIDYYTVNNNIIKAKGVIDVARYFHGDVFVETWNLLLKRLGFSYDEIKACQVLMQGFFCNYWVARKNVFLSYVHIHGNALSLMETDDDIKQLALSDSKYQGKLSKEHLMSISGFPYYTLHTFLLERLPSFYFAQQGLKMHRLGKTAHFSIPL